MRWIVRYKHHNGDDGLLILDYGKTKEETTRYLLKSGNFKKKDIITIIPDWVTDTSNAVRLENGEAEMRLAAKCNWEKRSRWGIIYEYGDPRLWK